jgi:RNA recognition motif-containing protein
MICTVFLITAFGFCEYGSPDSGLRAIRLLHDMDLGGKKLVVKVDAKTKTVLDEYKGTRISAITAVSEQITAHMQIFKAEHFEPKYLGFSNKYSTVIPRYMSNRFTSFRLYEMHKLIPVFQFTSQFLLIRTPSSRKPIVVPGASSQEVMGN